MEIDELITIAQAAQRMQVHRNSVYQAIEEGRLPSVTVLGKKAVRRSDVDEYLARVRPGGVKPTGRPRKTEGNDR